jgi:two-component system, chemotaxis family, response regulator Rcp1
MLEGRLPQKAIDILLIEDNQADAQLLNEVLKDAETPNKLHRVATGAEALDFLRRKGTWGRAPRPDLILLDLNLPERTGHEVLADLKRDRDLRRIPVVVLSASRDELDIRRAYELSACSYVCKPAFLDDFIGVVRFIEDFWLRTAKLPAY